MQIASDTLTFSDFCQTLDFFVSELQLSVGTIALRKVYVSNSQENAEEDGGKKKPVRKVQQPPFPGCSNGDQGDAFGGSSFGLGNKRKETRGVDIEAGSPAVEGCECEAQDDEAGDTQEIPWPLGPKERKVQSQEDQGRNDGGEPFLPTDVVKNRMDKEEHQVGEPDKRGPSMLTI